MLQRTLSHLDDDDDPELTDGDDELAHLKELVGCLESRSARRAGADAIKATVAAFAEHRRLLERKRHLLGLLDDAETTVGSDALRKDLDVCDEELVSDGGGGRQPGTSLAGRARRPSRGLYAPVAVGRWAPWAMWCALAASGAVVLLLFVRLARARAEAALSARHHVPLAALSIDIDKSKDINDAHGTTSVTSSSRRRPRPSPEHPRGRPGLGAGAARNG